jgi:hypothetical protein
MWIGFGVGFGNGDFFFFVICKFNFFYQLTFRCCCDPPRQYFCSLPRSLTGLCERYSLSYLGLFTFYLQSVLTWRRTSLPRQLLSYCLSWSSLYNVFTSTCVFKWYFLMHNIHEIVFTLQVREQLLSLVLTSIQSITRTSSMLRLRKCSRL